VELVDPRSQTILCRLYPQDKSANATGARRAINQHTPEAPAVANTAEMAPLLKQLMADYAATGLPPTYLPRGEDV
jgi:hypothetical protein